MVVQLNRHDRVVLLFWATTKMICETHWRFVESTATKARSTGKSLISSSEHISTCFFTLWLFVLLKHFQYFLCACVCGMWIHCTWMWFACACVWRVNSLMWCDLPCGVCREEEARSGLKSMVDRVFPPTWPFLKLMVDLQSMVDWDCHLVCCLFLLQSMVDSRF